MITVVKLFIPSVAIQVPIVIMRMGFVSNAQLEEMNVDRHIIDNVIKEIVDVALVVTICQIIVVWVLHVIQQTLNFRTAMGAGIVRCVNVCGGRRF